MKELNQDITYKVVPAEDYVLLLDNEDHLKTSGGLLLTSESQTETAKKLEILISKKYNEYIGNKAIVNKHSGISFKHNGIKYVIVHDREVLGIIGE